MDLDIDRFIEIFLPVSLFLIYTEYDHTQCDGYKLVD